MVVVGVVGKGPTFIIGVELTIEIQVSFHVVHILNYFGFR